MVISIADEIAQRGHDIDDAISSGYITIEELLNCISSIEKFSVIYNSLIQCSTDV